jgi:addiction module HigA family antidote
MSRKIPLIHPGEILKQEFLLPLEVSEYRLAKDTDVPPRRINEIVHGKRSITADTAFRLSRYFGTSERFWLNLQVRHDMELFKDKYGESVGSKIVARDFTAEYFGSGSDKPKDKDMPGKK